MPRSPAVRWTAPRVLMYHFFGDAPESGDPERLFVTRQALVEQLSWLSANGWTALTLDEYLAALAGAPTPPRAYLLTIDDGHESVLTVAAPVLAAAGVPAVLHVPAGLLGAHVSWSPPYAGEPLLDRDQLREVRDTGMEIGAHGYDHAELRGLGPADLAPHTEYARDLLAEHANVTPRAFAYPFGKWDPASRRSVAEAGYLAGFAVARHGGRFAIDRIRVCRGDSLATFRFKLSLPYRLLSRIAGRAWRIRHAGRRVVRPLAGRRAH